MLMIPCKHLDYTEGQYADCVIETCAPHFPDVRYWRRGKAWTDNGPGQPRNPEKVQFCGLGRGRINEIFGCYNGEMHCYDPAPSGKLCGRCRAPRPCHRGSEAVA